MLRPSSMDRNLSGGSWSSRRDGPALDVYCAEARDGSAGSALGLLGPLLVQAYAIAAPAAAPMRDPTIVRAAGLVVSSGFFGVACDCDCDLGAEGAAEPRSTAVVARDAYDLASDRDLEMVLSGRVELAREYALETNDRSSTDMSEALTSDRAEESPGQ